MNGSLIEEDSGSAAAVNSILKKYAEDLSPDASKNYAASKQLEEIKSQTIIFYFGDKVIGEVKFLKAGSKAEKIERSKKMLMKELLKKNQVGLVGQQLYSPFCKFKII